MNWENRYIMNDIPWNQGEAAPELVEILKKGIIKNQIIVPGCGFGHDCAMIAQNQSCQVLGLDLSITAIRQAVNRYGSLNNLKFVQGDIFRVSSEFEMQFDWLVEHTCFCALNPVDRKSYLDFATFILKPKAKLFGILFKDVEGNTGPPYPISKKDFENLFSKNFNLLSIWDAKKSFKGRENNEFCALLERS